MTGGPVGASYRGSRYAGASSWSLRVAPPPWGWSGVKSNWGSPATRGLLKIISGTGIGQAVALLSAPVISRLFPPETYGPFAVVNALVLPLAVIAALRYDSARSSGRPRRSRAGDTWPVYCSRPWGCRDCSGGDLGAGVGRWPAANTRGRGLPRWVPVVASLMGLFVVLNQLAVRLRLYAAIARRNILLAVSTTGFQVVAGLLGLGAHGLVGGLAFGQAVGVVALASSLRVSLRSRVSGRDLRRVATRFRSLPLLMAPSGLLNALGLQLPVLLASTLFGVQVAGWLGMTQRVSCSLSLCSGLLSPKSFSASSPRRRGQAVLSCRSSFLPRPRS